MKGKYKIISLDQIEDPERPVRSDLTIESVEDLITSIKEIGIIEPLIVRKKDGGFEIVAGHRRLLAAQYAGLVEAPCVIIEATGLKGEIIKLQENLIRRNVNPIDWANHIGHLKQQYKLSTAKIAEALGMSEAWVTQHEAILNYPPTLREALEQEQIAFASARELAAIKDPKKKDIYINHAIRGGVTPNLAARWRREANQEPVPESEPGKEAMSQEENQDAPPSDPICPVCSKPIKPGEEVVLRVHENCLPH